MMSPGLPASPRPANFQSPPLSPRGAVTNSLPLSPRAPRQPIPLPPNTARTHSPQMEPLSLTSPKPLNISKRASDSEKDSKASRESPVERNKIYQGFATEEYPELLLPPNALPSIIVKVASSRMKPSRASVMSLTQLEEDPVFTLAIYSRAQGGELWRVEKDTTSFGKLDQRMKLCSNFTAKTPDRSLFSGHAPAKLDTRRVVLDQYLDELLDTQLDQQSALELCKYLSTNTLPPMSDEAPSPNESNNDAGVQKKGPGGRPFKNGYLTKRGKNFGGWKARFFVLDGPHLKYYEAPGGAHLGTIKLQNAQIGKQSQNSNDGSPAQAPNGEELDNQYRHAFLVLEPKKKDSSSHVKHVLCAESDKERDQWVEALLRWIDYREPTDEESQSRERHGSGSQNHVNGANAKKKMYAQNKPHVSRANSQEALIGMSYDSARQGDIPDGAPPKRRGTNSPEFQEKPAGSAYTISAPKDPQIINESNPWSGKNVPTTPGPSYEEKKARKRSFFGFGPKTRASADDQDTLFGSSTTSNASQGQSVYRGQAQQVFGAPLAEAVRFHGPADVKVPLPSVVYRCIQYLDAKKAIFEEGIFRLSGSNVVIKQLRERFNNESDVNLLTDETYYDIHAVASLLKLYLRELPTTILTRDLHPHFMSITEMTNHREKIMALSELAQRLPLASDTLLKYLIAFLIKIINNSDRNKMTVRNVGIVFSPTLNIPAPVFALLLQNYEGVFGIAPEQYQLPSPGGPDPREKQPRAVVEKQPRAVVEQPPRAVVEQPPRAVVEQQPRRPSTAGAASSPSRQRLMEQMQQRSSPTPPPVMSSNGARPGATSATPPPRQVYEPSYYAQQGTSTQTSTRPAYESGFVVPSGYEQNIARATRQPAYDQPHYGNSYEGQYGSNGSPATYDPSYGNNQPKRRDSHMFFMGGNMLNHQGSNSRLREETRM
ncbi:hypothetical protein F4780DRAFT_731210 [Xylariomycetidae sp. FL0641]|nr:hypothetical protein F4780DRAFT_731210 [Xylariomycetidae sp. FL0641]